MSAVKKGYQHKSLFFNQAECLMMLLRALMGRRSRKNTGIVLITTLMGGASEYGIKQAYMEANGENLFGQFLMNQDKMMKQSEYEYILQTMSTGTQNNKYYEMAHKFLQQAVSLKHVKNVIKELKMLHGKDMIFMRQFKNSQSQKLEFWITKCQKFNINLINIYCQQICQQEQLTPKQETIKLLYENRIKVTSGRQIQYISYQLINQLKGMQDDKFNKEFDVYEQEHVILLNEMMQVHPIKDSCKLAMYAIIAKYVEYCDINLSFQTCFQLDNISEQMVNNMLFNIENKILKVEGTEHFIIFRRIRDNRITKILITDHTHQYIESLLQECHDGGLYDIIINEGRIYQNISQIRIRYLCWQRKIIHIEITLYYPNNLISASLREVTITNINECVNLVNLWSRENAYTIQDIGNMKKLKRIYSRCDTRENFLIDVLSSNTKLEYVHIIGQNNSIYEECQSLLKHSENIKNLRIYLCQHEQQSNRRRNEMHFKYIRASEIIFSQNDII